jgi:DNA invertase Pin-like site-specific DNA recombinase
MSSCSLYCRISLDPTGRMAGVQRQDTECRALADGLGLDVARVYVDNDISAYSGKRRPQFEALIASAPEAIVTWHLDRLVRRTRDLEPILALNVNVYTVAGGFVDLSSPAGRFNAHVIVAAAQYESEQKGERQRAMHRQRRARGGVWWQARCPVGFNPDGTVADAELIHGMYRALLAGETLAAIGRSVALTGDGARHALLAERNLPVVGAETFDAAGRVLRARHWRGAVEGMLSGIAVCHACGQTCRVGAQAKTPDRRAYRCRAGHVWWSLEVVDDYVGGAVADYLESHRDLIESAPADDSAELADLSGDYVAGRMTVEAFTAAAERIKQRAQRPAAPFVPWPLLTVPERRGMCAVVLEKVVLRRRGRGVRTAPEMSPDDLHWR